MSLNADVSKIPNWKTLCINPNPRRTTTTGAWRAKRPFLRVRGRSKAPGVTPGGLRRIV